MKLYAKHLEDGTEVWKNSMKTYGNLTVDLDRVLALYYGHGKLSIFFSNGNDLGYYDRNAKELYEQISKDLLEPMT